MYYNGPSIYRTGVASYTSFRGRILGVSLSKSHALTKLNTLPLSARPLQACTGLWVSRRLRLPEFLHSQHMKVVRLLVVRTGRLCPPEIPLVLVSVRRRVHPRAIVRPEGLNQSKIPMTPSGIDLASFWLVAQSLNQLHHHVPLYLI
jgi:hypothetical protein